MQNVSFLAGDSIEFDFGDTNQPKTISDKTQSKTISQDVEVYSCTLTELFEGQFGDLAIPEYQRPYVWSSQEIDKLLKDLMVYFSNEAATKPLYYLGSIILHDDGQQLNIIDGQQRITTFAILQYLLNETPLAINFTSPTTIDTIERNYLYLSKQKGIETIDLQKINVTLIITPNEDAAYTFFETQNTGGVKLRGIDIVKAHHLRALGSEMSRSHYALLWEQQKDLAHVLNLVLKARYWGVLNWQEIPYYKDEKAIKQAIIEEFSVRTLKKTSNLAYQTVILEKNQDNWCVAFPYYAYAIRQPLNDGQNFIDYLMCFSDIYHLLFTHSTKPSLSNEFYPFIEALIKVEDGTTFLKEFFEVALVSYVHRFGSENLTRVAFWLFRYIYSIRLSKERTVRENSISSFIKNGHYLIDHILTTFTPDDLIAKLRHFDYTIDEANCVGNTVKRRFVDRVATHFNMPPMDLATGQDVKNNFDKLLKQTIDAKTR